MTATNKTRWATKKELASFYQVSTKTIERWKSRGLLNYIQQGNVLRFPPECFDSGYMLRRDFEGGDL